MRVGQKINEGAGGQSIPRRAGRGPCPLSFAQERLWFLDQLEPQNPVYHNVEAVEWKGPLDRNALEKALDALVARHESLRTVFRAVDGIPVQVVTPARAVPFEVIDFRGGSPDEEEVRRQLKEKSRQPFDLGRDLMLRATLFRVGEDEYKLLLVIHHIASDGWSMGVLLRELGILYEAFRNRQPASLPELPIQYRDFAQWQREWLQGQVLQKQLSYWQERLAGAPALLQLWTDHPRPSLPTRSGARQAIALPEKLAHSLAALNKREGTTLFMALLAAFQVLLHRYTGQTDLCVGSPIANRSKLETEGLIGFFVNTLVLRADLSGDPSFREVLGRVQDVALEASANQDLPFQKLVEAFDPKRSLSHSPLFQVMFVLNETAEGIGLAGVRTRAEEIGSGTAKFDLMLSLEESGGRIWGHIEYDTDLFEAETIRRMAGHYETLLRAAVRDPDQRVSSLPMLTEPERRLLCVDWNDTRRAYPECGVCQLFEAQARQTPEFVAVEDDERQLTYQHLNVRANQLARHLQKLGVGPEVLVGILVDRSVEMVVALMGILKAGGAYVPLDPEYPLERLAFMVEDSKLQVLVTQRHFQDKLSDLRRELICLDADFGAIAGESPEDKPSGAQPDNLAYVTYTSGSTGVPKGVQIINRSLVNMLTSAQTRPGFTANDTILAATRLTFDVAALELFLPLIAGGRVVLASRETAEDGERLKEGLKGSAATVFQATPSTYRLLLESGWQGSKDIRIQAAGEALAPELARELLKRGASLWNLYGPTETTVYSTMCRVISAEGPISIGTPIGNTQCYVLDPHLQPLPIGVAGELHIGGAGLARGYLNRPELTAEKFIHHPFSDEPGARLYKTGDLARYLPDGNIEFLGRLDNQVKIRGFRIELGEIEAALQEHPAVSAAVVVMREDRPDDKRLVTYVVPKQAPAPTPGELRGFLGRRLPEFMLPSRFEFLPSLPLTPSGKVDRGALPAPGESRPEASAAFVAPGSELEEKLAGIWRDVLRLDRVGVHDNFFDLGGNSLLATQVISAVRKEFASQVPLRRLFEMPTLSGLALAVVESQAEQVGPADTCRILDELQEAGTPTEFFSREPRNLEDAGAIDLRQRIAGLPAHQLTLLEVRLRQKLEEASGGQGIPRRSGTGPSPLSFAQERLWFLDQLETRSPVYNIAQAVRWKGPLDRLALEKALHAVVARHESLHTVFRSVEGIPVQVVTPDWALPFEVIDLRGHPSGEEEVRRRLKERSRLPFDLSRDLMLRATLFQVDEDEFWLLLVIHHVASDGWSMGVLLRDLGILYEASRNGQPASLPELPIQYRDFAQWQREWLQGEVLETQLSHWRERLAGASAALQLRTDHPRPSQPTHAGAREEVVLPEVLTKSLAGLSRREEATLFMTLLAGFQVLLHRYTGQTDFCVGSPIANRSRVDTQALIGFFVNTLVLRADLSGDPSFREVLARVRESALEAYAHQDLPFQKLAETLEPQRSLSHSPLFQVMFVLQNAPSGSLPLGGVSARPSEVDTDTAKFDLTVSLEESGGCITGLVEYSTDLFEAETIRRMVGHYETLLASAIQDPDQRISALQMLTQPERQQLLVEWNNTRREYPRRCVHELFEEQAERTPDAVAVTFGDRSLAYHDLNRRANRLAYQLRQWGVERETRVAICAERSPELVVGLLGILKAGGAYVPLDAVYPRERLAFMLDDIEAPVLLTQRSLEDQLPSTQARVFLLDEFLESPSDEDFPNPSSGLTPEGLAYIMYTSGSTGKPKGVEVVHRGIVRLLFGTDFARMGEDESILQLAPTSFDASTFEIWGALLHGGRCVLFPQRVPTAKELESELKKRGVNTLWLTASLFNSVIDEAPLALSGIQQLLVGGEALSAPHIRRALELLPATQLVNGYGPTESTTFTCCYRIPPTLDTHGASIPIGRPIANTRVYILDGHLQPVPIGVAGELHVGGDGLARGYLNRSELTGEKFIPDPFREEPGARLYKTGDLARYRPDGNIEFLGRLDHQVKIRGYRVELGEIEAVLGQHPAVKTTAVVVREDAPGDRRLVAYVVPKQGQAPTTEGLRNFLGQSLPDFMLPSRIELLEALPLTPSGKANRGALPAPGESRPEVAQAFVAPQTEMEERLARIWCDVLRLEEVGIHDNFFDLGGHSLLATKLMARVERAFGETLPLAALFQAPTIQHLAALLSEQRKLEAIPGIVPIQPVGSRPPFFCLGAGPLFRPLAQRLDPDQPFLGLGLGKEDIQNLPVRFKLEDMAAVLARKMREIQPAGPYCLGGWCLDGVLAYETARQLATQDETVALLVLFDAPNPNPSPQTSNSKGSEWGRLLRRIRHHHFKNLRRMTMRERLEYLRNRLRTRVTILKHTSWETSYQLRLHATGNANGLPRVFDSMEYVAVRHYRPKPYSGRILLIQGDLPLEAFSTDPEMGWGDVVSGGLEIYSASGGHQGMFKEPHVDTLADKLGASLVEAQATSATSRPAAAPRPG